MSNMLSTGVSGLLAMQTALDTTSHNIANASTTGYSRQGVVFDEAQPEFASVGWIGNGVNVTSVRRFYDDLVSSQVRTASSSMNQWEVYASFSDQINNLFSSSSTGLSTSLQDLADAFQGVANSPTSSSERQVLLSKAQLLVSRLQSYDSRLDQLDTQVNTQLSGEAQTISGLADSIANINAQIAAASARSGTTPNDLLDERDRYLDELATHVNISTVKQDDGQVNVFIGSGQSLVLGASAADLKSVADPYDPTRVSLALQNGSGAALDVSNLLSGGTLGGLLSFRDEVLDPAHNRLGQIAVATATLINDQQAEGLDQYGSLGSDMFSLGDVQVQENGANTGSATVTATRSDGAAITTDDYVLSYTASGWTMKSLQTGVTSALSGAGTAASPLVGEGLSLVVSGSASVGDSFLVKPTSGAVDGMSLLLNDPALVAAAAPIIGEADADNTGSAMISQGVVTDAGNASLLTTVTIEFLSATTYTTDGGATTNTYTSGQSISLNGWSVTLTGQPATGDVFTVSSNSSGSGDNRNALLMANLLDQDYLNGGTTSVNDALGNWVADLGVKSNSANANYEAQSAVYDDASSALQSVSGVNLDEEAANLVRYQQAYAAMAKVISTSNELFNTLLDAFN